MQVRAVSLFKQTILKGEKRSIESILLEAGYAPESARQMINIMAGLQPHLDPFISKLEAHRDRVLAKMEEKIDLASYSDLTRALDVSSTLGRLFAGKTTKNLGVIVGERRRELDDLIDG